MGPEIAEYLRPWKLLTLSLGIGVLILGSLHFQAADWDISISLIMAMLTYFAAPWSLRVILERRWRQWPAMLIATWFSIDGSYSLYWHFKNPSALESMRKANFFASLALFGICGVIWLYRGNLKQLLLEFTTHRGKMMANIGLNGRRPYLGGITGRRRRLARR